MDADLWALETEARAQGYRTIAGVDEVGRGPLAGPVVAAAVILPHSLAGSGLQDSKKLSPKKRRHLYQVIYQNATAIGLGIVDPVEIDRVNILNASLAAMAMAVANLSPEPDFLLIDGQFRISSSPSQRPVVKGDALSASIAAASIVAKVSRDALMDRYDEEYPQFGFARHKGYPTRDHRNALAVHGPCPIHRLSFRGAAAAGRTIP
ncbi:MAG TPA: ribonuclease HII [Desulfobacteraceae bacterium]|nr:ribonuclease HII [Desulfobacteraceae bacterium]